MPAWPSTIPQSPHGWSGGPQDNKVSFQPDVGPSIDRRRASLAQAVYEVELPVMTAAQLVLFDTFYRTTLKDGTLTFTWNPRTGTAQTWKFTGPYKEEYLGPNLFKVSFSLMQMP